MNNFFNFFAPLNRKESAASAKSFKIEVCIDESKKLTFSIGQKDASLKLIEEKIKERFRLLPPFNICYYKPGQGLITIGNDKALMSLLLASSYESDATQLLLSPREFEPLSIFGDISPPTILGDNSPPNSFIAESSNVPWQNLTLKRVEQISKARSIDYDNISSSSPDYIAPPERESFARPTPRPTQINVVPQTISGIVPDASASPSNNQYLQYREKVDFMISYSWRNKYRVTIIKQELERRGFSTWFDSDHPSANVIDENVAGIFACHMFIFCISQDSVRSLSCKKELLYANELKKPIMPIYLDNTMENEFGFQSVETIRFITVGLTFIDLRYSWSDASEIQPRIDQIRDIYKSVGLAASRVVSTSAVNPRVVSAEELWGWLDPADMSKESLTYETDTSLSIGGKELSQMIDSREPQVLWIQGAIGVGKTGLAHRISKFTECVSIFYCRRDNSQKSDVSCVLRTIAFDISKRFPDFFNHLCNLFLRDEQMKSHGDVSILNSTVATLYKLLILDGFKYVTDRVLIVIDGIDACGEPGDEQRNDLISIIAEAKSVLPSFVKLIVTSRPERDIWTCLTVTKIDCVVIQPLSPSDMRTYVANRLGKLLPLSGAESSSVITAVVAKSDRIIKCAAYLCNQIEALNLTDSASIMAFLNDRFEQWDGIYDTLLGVNDSSDMRLVVSIICSARKPLTVLGIANLLNILEERVENVHNSLRSILITEQDGSITYFHQSLREFVLNPPISQKKIRPDVLITNCCFRTLTEELKFNIAGVDEEHFYFPNSTFLDLYPSIPDHLKYSALYSTSHLEGFISNASAEEIDSLAGTVKKIVNTQLVYWMELLSLLNQFPRIISITKTLESVFRDLDRESPESKLFFNLLSDSRRVCGRFLVPISKCAFQVYWSAIPFSPLDTAVHKTFIKLQPKYAHPRILDASTSGSRWSSCITTIEGRTGHITSIATIPDGSLVVSGSTDGYVKVWDSSAGNELQSLSVGEVWVTAVALSNDGNRMVCGSDHGEIQVWKTDRWSRLLKWKEHGSVVSSLAIDSEVSLILSGSWDFTVKIWDLNSGRILRTLVGHTSFVNAVAFNSDGQRVISGSSDKLVKVWNAENGEELHSLSGHNDAVNSVAFSEYGKHIISGSSDKTLKIWNINSGDLVRTLTGSGEGISAVCVEGHKIASGSFDGVVHLWDGSTGKVLRSFVEHTKPVSSVLLVNDGTKILSGSFDHTIKVWDTTYTYDSSMEVTEVKVTSAAFSKDGRLLVSGGNDNIVRIWDASNGKLKRIIRDHNTSVVDLTISVVGDVIKSTETSGIVKFYSADSGISVKDVPDTEFSSKTDLRKWGNSCWLKSDVVDIFWILGQWRDSKVALSDSRIAIFVSNRTHPILIDISDYSDIITKFVFEDEIATIANSWEVNCVGIEQHLSPLKDFVPNSVSEDTLKISRKDILRFCNPLGDDEGNSGKVELEKERVLWMIGSIGIGKSTIASFIPPLVQRENIFCSFVSTGIEDPHVSAVSIIRTICFHLSKWNAEFADFVLNTILREFVEYGSFVAGKITIEQLVLKLILEPLQKVLKFGNPASHFVVVIDNVDRVESAGMRNDFLEQLCSLSISLPYFSKFLIIARPQFDVLKFTEQSLCRYLRPTDKSNFLDLSDLIQSFLKDCDLISLPDRAHVTNVLIKLCGGRLSALVDIFKNLEHEIRDFSLDNLLDALKRLREKETKMLENVDLQNSKPTNEQVANLLRTLTAIFEPVTALDLSEHLNLPVESIERIVDEMKAILYIDGQRNIRFAHKRARVSVIENIESEQVHFELAKTCLTILIRDLRYDMGNITSRTFDVQKDISFFVIDDSSVDNPTGDGLMASIPSFLQYAARNFWRHILKSKNLFDRFDLIEEFFTHKILNWVELLCLINSTSTIPVACSIMADVCPPVSTSSVIMENLCNVVQIYQKHNGAITSNPLNTYVTDVSFTNIPQGSQTYRMLSPLNFDICMTYSETELALGASIASKLQLTLSRHFSVKVEMVRPALSDCKAVIYIITPELLSSMQEKLENEQVELTLMDIEDGLALKEDRKEFLILILLVSTTSVLDSKRLLSFTDSLLVHNYRGKPVSKTFLSLADMPIFTTQQFNLADAVNQIFQFISLACADGVIFKSLVIVRTSSHGVLRDFVLNSKEEFQLPPNCEIVHRLHVPFFPDRKPEGWVKFSVLQYASDSTVWDKNAVSDRGKDLRRSKLIMDDETETGWERAADLEFFACIDPNLTDYRLKEYRFFGANKEKHYSVGLILNSTDEEPLVVGQPEYNFMFSFWLP
ncbi:hypothetical protein HK098_001659 [Nowakowskiella sp. JEL0407]|nr:hypothetical protein HK098_001659 [Nowakowskiella sp. JEL0407]